MSPSWMMLFHRCSVFFSTPNDWKGKGILHKIANAKYFWTTLYLEDVDDADEEEEVLAAVVLGGDPAPHVAHRRGVVDLMEQVMSSQFKSYPHILRFESPLSKHVTSP